MLNTRPWSAESIFLSSIINNSRRQYEAVNTMDDESEYSDSNGSPPPYARVRLRVLGMMCQHNCDATVERALRSNLVGVVDGVVSFAGSWAEVSVDIMHEL